MEKNTFEFKEWNDDCEHAWKREIPQFQLRTIPPYVSANFASGQYDLMSVQILEDIGHDDEPNCI